MSERQHIPRSARVDPSTIPELLKGKDPGTPEAWSERIESAEPTINIEDRRLPGNTGWIGRVATATEGRWAAHKTSALTLKDRFMADRHGRTADVYDGRISTLTSERMRYMQKKMDAQAQRVALKYDDSMLNRFAVGPWIKDTRTSWYSWKEARSDRMMQKTERDIANAQKSKKRAEQRQMFFDKRAQLKSEAAARAFDQRALSIENLNTECESAVERLSGELTTHLEKANAATVAIEQLMQERRSQPETPAQAKHNDAQLEELMGQKYEAEALAKQAQKKLDRSYKHLIRLSRAEDVVSVAQARILGRYAVRTEEASLAEAPNTAAPSGEAQHTSEEQPARQEAEELIPVNDTGEVAPNETASNVGAFVQDMSEVIELSESVKEATCTPQQFIKIWNVEFPKAAFTDTEDLLQNLLHSAESRTPPDLEMNAVITRIRAKESIRIKDWERLFDRVSERNPAFRERLKKTGLDTRHAMTLLALSVE